MPWEEISTSYSPFETLSGAGVSPYSVTAYGAAAAYACYTASTHQCDDGWIVDGARHRHSVTVHATHVMAVNEVQVHPAG